VNRRASGTESQTIAFKLCVGRTGRIGMAALLPPAPQLEPYLTLPLEGGRHGAGSSVFAFGVITWVVVAERPPKSPVRAADPDLHLVLESVRRERSEYMRTER
jgi:hypothetical protein